MGRRGRPPKPIERHRAEGTYRKDRHAQPQLAVVLPMARGVPAPPVELGQAGSQLWEKAWAEAITWLSPDSDMQAVINACMNADSLAIARRRYQATSDPADARALVALEKAFREALSALGFDPTARSRLGVAEVKAASALEQLAERRNRRAAGAGQQPGQRPTR